MKNKKQAANLDELAASRTDLFFIAPSGIEPDIFIDPASPARTERFNPREDFGDSLAPSIRRNVEAHGPKYGVELPILGYFHKESGKFRFTDGERRWRGAVEVAKDGTEIFLPCKPHPKNYSITSRLLDVLTTSTGKPLTMMEQARQCSRLIALEVAPTDIAKAEIARARTSPPASHCSPSPTSSSTLCKRRR